MRVFLGVKLPDQLRRELTARLDILPELPPLRWVAPQRWHLTLQFLGSWPPGRLNQLEDHLLWSKQVSAFEVRIGAAGRFPARGPVRVFYLHLDGGKRLPELAKKVRAAVDATWPDGPQDRKPFRPHLTLARGARKPVAVVLPRIAGDPPLSPWRVDGFGLFSSELTPRGPIYREEAFFRLRK